MIKILAGRVKDCLLYNEGQTYGQHGEVMGHVDESLNPCQAMMVRLTIISSNRIFWWILSSCEDLLKRWHD